ncbi:MAG: CDP-alcohol phosphatidyltransferase family protein [Alphaproteobacteria bacterium]|nr:CDP-alcohol phosphatidyltransferase family protein [Alphaproteobacteria bacterium]
MRAPDPVQNPAIRLIGNSPVPVWGLDGATRLARTLHSFGMADIAPWPDSAARAPFVVLIHAGFLVEDNLLRKLIASPGKYLLDPASGQVVAAHVAADSAPAMAELIQKNLPLAASGLPEGVIATPLSLAEAEDYSHEVKKRISAFVMPITAATKGQIERHLFGAVYKGVTDIVTKYVWPWPAYHVTRACAATGITPNMVTSASAVLTVMAYFLFAGGLFGWGLVAAWGMTFLDTVDGKLARVTVNSSAFGNIFDHGIDLVHPPFWYWAWIVGISSAGGSLWQGEIIAAIVIGGYVFQRLQEGAFKLFFGVTLHVWRPVDSRFRLINARRNPNLVILMAGAMLGRPDIGMIIVAVWTLACIGVHFVQIAQAVACKLRREPIRSWLAT